MQKGLNGEDILCHEDIKQFKTRCLQYVEMCDVALSCNEDSEYANAYIKKIMDAHKFKH